MLKIRVEGKEKEIYDYIDLIRNSDEYTVNSISRLFKNNESMSVYSRRYIEIELDNDEGDYYAG